MRGAYTPKNKTTHIHVKQNEQTNKQTNNNKQVKRVHAKLVSNLGSKLVSNLGSRQAAN